MTTDEVKVEIQDEQAAATTISTTSTATARTPSATTKGEKSVKQKQGVEKVKGN